MFLQNFWTKRTLKKREDAVCKTLKKAIDILETEGWTQGEYFKGGQGYCILGSVAKASGYQDFAIDDYPTTSNSTLYRDCIEKIRIYLSKHDLETFPTRFNDSYATTKEDVINVLRNACK